jgi:hypothetical protein
MSNLSFKLMAVGFKVRDALKPRKNIVDKVGIKPGFN